MAVPSYRSKYYHGSMNNPEDVTEQFLLCRLCKQELKHSPKILECGHTFCRPCLDAYTQCACVRDVCCPTCARPTPLLPEPCRGVDKALPNSVFIETQMDHLIRRQNKATGRESSNYHLTCFETEGITQPAVFGVDRYCYESYLPSEPRKC